MTEFQFTSDEWSNVFDETILSLQKAESNSFFLDDLLDSINTSIPDMGEAERLMYSITSELFDDDHVAELYKKADDVIWYDYLQLQIYLFLEKKGAYTDNAILSFSAAGIIIGDLSAKVCEHYGIQDRIIPLTVALIFLVICKVSAKTWCSYFFDKRISKNPQLNAAYKKEIEKNQ